jgi:signal peptidase I
MARVPTGSMMNTIIPGDHIMVHKSFGQIERGQVVVFQFPEDPTYYLSRVIGLPGETLQVRGTTVYINERPLEEERVLARDSGGYEPLAEISTEGNGLYRVFYSKQVEDLSSEAFGDFGTSTPFEIPKDTFFLMGDNRYNTIDSRFRGPVPERLIWGKPSIIYYSQAMSPDGKIRWERMFKKVH